MAKSRESFTRTQRLKVRAENKQKLRASQDRDALANALATRFDQANTQSNMYELLGDAGLMVAGLRQVGAETVLDRLLNKMFGSRHP